MEPQDLAERLRAMANALSSLASELEGEEVEFPAFAKEKMENGICLFCDKPLDFDGHDTRGVHRRCYQKHWNKVKSGFYTWEQAIRVGRIAPSGTSGVKPDLRVVEEIQNYSKKSDKPDS